MKKAKSYNSIGNTKNNKLNFELDLVKTVILYINQINRSYPMQSNCTECTLDNHICKLLKDCIYGETEEPNKKEEEIVVPDEN